jgi:hypothetical protein
MSPGFIALIRYPRYRDRFGYRDRFAFEMKLNQDNKSCRKQTYAAKYLYLEEFARNVRGGGH